MTVCLQLHSLNVVSTFSNSPHGRLASPAGMWYYAVAAVSIAVVIVAAYFCIKCFLLPTEEEEAHIKRRILSDIYLTEEEGSSEREARE
jgi:phosphotransferase system  glucose/maltose/N-acetylglucosamine-specific IIC component